MTNVADMFADDVETEISGGDGETVRITLVVDFKVYKEGGAFAPTLKPEGKEAQFAFGNLTKEHAEIIAAKIGLPAGKPWKAGGIRFGIPASNLTPAMRDAAMKRGKAKVVAQKEAMAKRTASAGVR